MENAADLEKAEKTIKELEDKKDEDKKDEDKKPVQLSQPVIQSVKSTASKKDGSRVKITVSRTRGGTEDRSLPQGRRQQGPDRHHRGDRCI